MEIFCIVQNCPQMQTLVLKTPILRKFRGKVENFGTHNLLSRKFAAVGPTLDFCRKLAFFLIHESAARTKDHLKKWLGLAVFLSIIMPSYTDVRRPKACLAVAAPRRVQGMPPFEAWPPFEFHRHKAKCSPRITKLW